MRCVLMIVALTPAVARGVDIPTFTDQTEAAGLSFTHQTTLKNLEERHMMSPGVAVGDFNRDGYLDLFVQGGTGQNSALFINNADGTFTDLAAQWGINLTGVEGSSATVADIDANGYLDIYAGALDGRNYLYMNTGGGYFEERGVELGIALIDGTPFNTYGATFGDIDLDGDLDLVTADWGGPPTGGNRLFLNTIPDPFLDVTDAAGVYVLPTTMYPFSPGLVDVNGDHYPDLLIAGDFGTTLYHANNGDGTFQFNGTGTDENGMGSTFGDYDNDGDLDWFVTSIYDDDGVVEGNWGITGNRLYRNEGNHQYTDVTDLAGVRNGYWGWGTSFGDLNNDGLLDLAMTNGFLGPGGFNPDPTFETDPSRLWINTGDFIAGPTYIEVSSEAGLVHTAPGKGLVTFDADNDGDLDIVITTTHGDMKFFRNEYNPSSSTWIQIELVSPVGNAPDGIGATIDLTDDGVTYHRAVFGSPSFMSQDPLRVHFGFPATKTIDNIVVNWPDGTSTVIIDVPTGRILEVRTADLNGDGVVNVPDLLALLAAWGPCSGCPEDLDGNGIVDVLDLLQLLANWGA